MSATSRFPILAIAGLLALAVPSVASGQSTTNRISGVDVVEAPDATFVRIQGSAPPTYSVYKLRNPSRIFVDVSAAEFGPGVSDVPVHNGVVNVVATVPRVEGVSSTVRVMIGLDVDAIYDVQVEGRDLVLQVDGAPRPAQPVASTRGLEEELAAARDRIAALESAADAASQRGDDQEAEALRQQATQEREARTALEAELANARAELSQSEARSAELADALARTESERDEASRAAETERQRALQAESRARAEREAADRAQSERAQAERTATPATQRADATPRIRDVRFEQEGDVSRVVIEVSSTARYAAEAWDDERAAIVFEGAELADHLRRRLDTSAFSGPVQTVASFTDDTGRAVVLAETRGMASELLRQDGDRLIWEFTSAQGAGVNAVATTPAQPNLMSQAQPRMQPAAATAPSDPRTRRPRMVRKRITIDLRNADILNVLRLLAEEGNINLITSPGVSGNVTLRLRSVPLDEAFVLILRSNNLGWEQEGNIVRVAPQSVFEAEQERELRRLAESFEVEPLAVRMVPVNYTTGAAIRGLVSPLLSSRGSVAVDARTNTLIITDIRANLDAIESLAEQLDSQTPQILIEARIVETNDQFRRQLGIQWGGAFVADQAIGNATGLRFPSTLGIAGGASDGSSPTAGTASNPNFAVNLPAPAGTGTGGAVGMTLGSLGGAFNLNLRLSAAESSGTAKIVSAPRIMTLDNQSASITSGISIPASVVSAAGAQTVFFDASLSLNVTPRVTPDGNIFLQVSISKNEPDFENTGSRGDPSIIRREASTQLLVRDGDTTVIGGIFQRNTGSSSSRVPFFSRLPLIGPIFRNHTQTDVRNELLVFITPRIVNRDLSIDRIGRGDDLAPPREN